MEEKKSETIFERSNQINREKKRHRGVVLFLLIISIFFGFLLLWRFLNSPAVGTVGPGMLPKTEESFEKNTERKRYSGKYLTFSYPAVYLEKYHELPEGGPIKERALLSTNDVEGRKIAVTVAKREGGDLLSDPSFQMRKLATEEYQERDATVGSYHGVLFEKSELPSEVTFFVTREGYIISISVSSPFGRDGLEEVFVNEIQELTFSLP